jgi:short subunit dehydrogenase-like uncharacterized protein
VAVAGGVFSVSKRLATGSATGPGKGIGKKFEYPAIVPPAQAPPALHLREFDLVVFGATGFTGGIAARYLSKQYPSGEVKWAIAGRRKEALDKVKASCLAINPNLQLTVIDGVDSSQDSALQAMTARARCVITTVGPFQLYGTPLVRACIATGTSCCDITGEMDWYGGLVEAYDEAARAAGSKIVVRNFE